uniref:Uncharacterized protein n=2 Tax=Candidatus Kentrum sp. FW TaxID=2126338 RepID=A0A450T7J7_9GAMM|nr:MAG: hypothetical protein BECKFW1821B_GA0114236_107418 [Candidatus Kentron sp. FW]
MDGRQGAYLFCQLSEEPCGESQPTVSYFLPYPACLKTKRVSNMTLPEQNMQTLPDKVPILHPNRIAELGNFVDSLRLSDDSS